MDSIQNLTSAAEVQETTMMLMQPNANWEEYLTPAPLAILIMAELVFISSGTDFSLNKNPPEGGFKYIRYPESFRASLTQVANLGWHAFNEADKNMDKIRIHTATVPDYIKVANKILFHGSDEVIEALLPNQLENIRTIADECVTLASNVENKYSDVIKLIQELLEACVNAKYFYGKELDMVQIKLNETKNREKTAKENEHMYRKAMEVTVEQLDEAQHGYTEAMNSLPSGREMIEMDKAEERSSFLNVIIFLFTGSGPLSRESASQRAAENARYRLQISSDQLKEARDHYQKNMENMQKNHMELNEILVELQNCEIKEIDFNTTIKMLVKGLDAMGRVKEQWEKMVRFFQMVSTIVHASLSKTLHNFVTTSDDTKKLSYDGKLFAKDLLYNQAFQASTIASLVHMISGTYCEVSEKYLMDRVSSLGKLIAMDKEKPEFMQERLNLQQSCKEAQEGILQLVLKNKKEFEIKTSARIAKIEKGLQAILPATAPQEKIPEHMENGSDDEDQYTAGQDKTQKIEL